MKRLVLFCTLLVSSGRFLSAQTQIIDPNFDNSDSCVTGLDQFHRLIHWDKVTGEPEFYDCDFTFIIDHAVSDYDAGFGHFVGMKLEDDSVMTAESFGQNLNEVIPPGYQVDISFIAQGPYGGLYSGDCAGLSVFGLKDSIQTNLSLNNIGEYPDVIELATTSDAYDYFWWERDTVSFVTPDSISALVFSPQLVPGCRQYVFVDQIEISSVEPLIIICGPFLPEELIIYPNPVNDVLNLSIPEELLEAHFEIISESGDLVKQGTLTHEIDVYSLARGAYFLRVYGEDGVVEESFLKVNR